MSAEESSLDQIAESIGTVTEERNEEHDNKLEEDEVKTFVVDEFLRNMEEYDGDW